LYFSSAEWSVQIKKYYALFIKIKLFLGMGNEWEDVDLTPKFEKNACKYSGESHNS